MVVGRLRSVWLDAATGWWMEGQVDELGEMWGETCSAGLWGDG